MNDDYFLGFGWGLGLGWDSREPLEKRELRIFTAENTNLRLLDVSSYFTFLSLFFFLSRYASLYFCCAVENQDNELLTLEVVHRYVELLDKYFGNVSAVLIYLELVPVSALRSVLSLSHALSLSSLTYELHLHKDQNTRHSPTSCGSL